MPTYTNGFAPTGPAPKTYRDALAALLNGDHALYMTGGGTPPSAVLANAIAQPSTNALAQFAQPYGGVMMKPTHSTAEEGTQPRMIGGLSDSPVTIDTPAASSLPTPTQSPVSLDLTNASVKKPSFFAPGGVGREIIGILSDGLAGAAGQPGTYLQHKMQLAQQAREDARLKLAEDRENRIANRPVFNTLPNIGLVSTNPDTGQSQVIQPARSAARAYVEDDLGLKPTDPEYQVALADYLLKANGPTAFGYRAALQDDRQEAQASLQEDRQAAAIEAMRTRLGLNEKMASYREGLRRSRPSAAGGAGGGGSHRTGYADVFAPILQKMARGEPLTPGEQQALAMRGRRGGGATGGIPTAGGYTVRPGGGPPRVPGTKETPAFVADAAEVQHLPSGTWFRTPDGRVMQRK